MTITVAVDAMGGDVGLKVTVPASIQFLQSHPDTCLILVGDVAALEAELQHQPSVPRKRLILQASTQVVAMDEAPQLALKNKKDSSMRVAINQVKEGQAQAAVSAGNTGALMATARFVLKTLPGIDRPAIAKIMPTVKGTTCVLDLGANIDCTPEQLLQFGIMGAELVACLSGTSRPTVGLLNIGSEDMKGGETLRQTAELLRQSSLNFQGNVEGGDISKGTVDVIVCDGFAGNVALKSIEGLAHMLAVFLRQEFSRSWWTKLCAIAAWPVLTAFKKRVDPRRYNGASLLGLRGIVVKSHGGADITAFRYALEQAYHEAHADVIAHITEQVAHQLTLLKPVQD